MFGLPSDVLMLSFVVAVCVILLGVGIFLPRLTTEKRTSERLSGIKSETPGAATVGRAKDDEAAKRRKNVQATLQKIDEKAKQQKNVSLSVMITRSGLKISKPVFFVLSGVTGVLIGFGAFIGGLSPIICLLFAFVGAVGLPRFILRVLMNRRAKAFLDELPEAVDIIVRGVKAGLPLNDCLRLVSREAKEPLASEFKGVVEAQQLGVPMGQAISKMRENMPLPETNFLATVIIIQQSSGGSLAEALGNLSKILRDRKKMKKKIKAVSSEAKISAVIIGGLPLFIALALYFLAPEYVSLLFTTTTGNYAIGAIVCLMALGTFIMRQMINFKI